MGRHTTIQTVVYASIIIFVVFAGMFLFYADEASHSAYPLDAKTNQTYGNLSTNFDSMNRTMSNFKEKVFAISESSGVIETAISTVKGFTAAVLLLGETISFTLSSVTILLVGMPISVPWWASVALFLLVVVILIFAIARAVSGRDEI